MPPSNSTRKVAKAARSTSARRAATSRKNRSVSFPLAMGVIVLLGLVLIFAGRSRRISAVDTLPRVNKDHWHAAYGIYICDKFQPPLSDPSGDARGIHTHGDGVIHVHPYTSAAAGKHATISNFFDNEKMTVTDSKIVLQSGETWTNGKNCGDKPGKVVLAEWQDASSNDKPKIITSNISGTRFTKDRMAFTLAFVPADKVDSLPKPDSVPTLDNLSDVAGSTPATTAPAAGDSSTTAPGGSTTTAAGGSPTTTAAPGAPTTSAPAGSSTTAAGGAPTTAAPGSSTTAK